MQRLLFAVAVMAQAPRNECMSGPCRNGATCSDSTSNPSLPVGSYSCACLDGYANGWCNEAYTAAGAEIVANYTSACAVRLSTDLVGGGNCDVDVNECDSNPCQNGATCYESVSDWTCDCLYVDRHHRTGVRRAFNGERCESEIDVGNRSALTTDEGRSATCGGQATVVPTSCSGTATPTCPAVRCAELDVAAVAPNCDLSAETDGTAECPDGCVFVTEQPACIFGTSDYCPDGCNYFVVDVNECSSNPCVNGALCSDSRDNLYDAYHNPDGVSFGAYRCTCHVGYMGGWCDYNYHRYDDSPELLVLAQQCTVAEGDICNIDVDECKSNPCQNGAACTESQTDILVSADQFSCACQIGYSNGLCAWHGSHIIPEYRDSCNVAEGGACNVDINECDSGPCQNLAVCFDSNGGPAVGLDAYRCDCEPGWGGGNCNIDTDECLSGPCVNRAECSDSRDTLYDPVNNPNGVSLGAYRCTCIFGYAGGWCDYDYLIDSAIQCTVRDSRFLPLQPGNCEVDFDECAIQPHGGDWGRMSKCQNGGECYDSRNTSDVPPGEFRCTCVDGYSSSANYGDDSNLLGCDIDIDECASSPCLEDGADCTDSNTHGHPYAVPIAEYRCHCPPGHYNATNGVVVCSTGVECAMNGSMGGTGCQPCPDSCTRCSVGPDGLSPTVLALPGYGMAHELAGNSLAEIHAQGNYDTVVLYPCPIASTCVGDHFIVASSLVNKSNVDSFSACAYRESGSKAMSAMVALVEAAGTEWWPQELSKSITWSESTANDRGKAIQSLQGALREYYLNTPDSRVVVCDSAMVALARDHVVTLNVSEITAFGCVTGHNLNSPVCALCTDGYAGGSSTECVNCEGAATNALLVIVICIAVYSTVVFFHNRLKERKQRLKREADGNPVGLVHVNQECMGREEASIMVYAKCIISHFQILQQFELVLDIQFPERFQNCLYYMKVLEGNIIAYLHIKCQLPIGLYIEFYIVILLIPMVLLAGIGSKLYQERYKAGTASRIGGGIARSPWAVLQNRMFMTVFVFYTFITTRIFHMFSCRSLYDGLGTYESWHRWDYEIDCNGTTYRLHWHLATIMAFVYPVGLPVVSLWIMYKNADRLKHASAPQAFDHWSDDSEAPHASDAPATSSERSLWAVQQQKESTLPWWYGDRQTFGFMVLDYKPSCYFFEIVEFSRKLVLTGLLMLLQTGSVMQIFAGIASAFCFGAVNAVVRPYADPRANMMRLTVDASLFFTLLSILVIRFKDHISSCDDMNIDRLGWFLVGINFALLLLVIGSEMIVRAMRTYNDALSVGISYSPDSPLNARTPAPGADPSTRFHQRTNAASCVVYRGEYKATANASSMLCAVKVRPSHKDSQIMTVEAAIMARCNHSNIASIFHLEEDISLYYVCLELCGESVETAVQHGALTTETRVEICRSMVAGAEAFHSAGFYHGNLTASNFVLGNDGQPRLCGFSSAGILTGALLTRLNTVFWTVGYLPPEVIRTRKLHVDVSLPLAVDTFSLGVAFCFVLSNGCMPFCADTDAPASVENNIMTGKHCVDTVATLSAEAKHLITMMLAVDPVDRPPLRYIQNGHPIFWSLKEKIKFIGEHVGLELPVRIHKSKNKLIEALEEAFDRELGAYNEGDCEAGGSWARCLDTRYPLTGNWGKAQRPPEEEERHYHIYGAPAKAKQTKEREAMILAGKPLGRGHAAKEIRSVGYLKFIRNMDAHAGQAVQAGRFESVDTLWHYLLDPFPWLLMAVFCAHQQHGSTEEEPEHSETSNPLSNQGPAQPR